MEQEKKALDNISLEINKGENDCINRFSCQRNTLCPEVGVHGCFAAKCKRCPEGIICSSICDNYDSFQCDLLDKPPYVCSNCKMQKGCKKNKAYYSAHKANAAHHKSIRDAHSGVRLRRLCTGNVDLREFSQSLNISTVKAIRLRISIPSQKPIPTFQSLRWIP